MKLRLEYLISYDIESNKNRTMLFKQLQAYGLRPLQKSVFWGCLSKAELLSIQRELKSLLAENDKALVVRTNIASRSQGFFVGHRMEEFSDWQETLVI